MDMVTLLKAALRKKKSTFISIMLLTALIAALITVVFGVRAHYESALDRAYTDAGAGDINASLLPENDTAALRQSVENSSLVSKVSYLDTMIAGSAAVGENESDSAFFLTEMTEKIKLYNADADGFVTNVPALSAGELYVPLGLKNKMNCKIGDTMTLSLIGDVNAEFVIKGFVQEPILGSMTIGSKFVFICPADFEKYLAQCKPFETKDAQLEITIMRVWQAEDSGLSVAKFQRQLNLETKLTDYAQFTMNQAQSRNYTTLLPDMLLDVMLVFAILLFVTVLIVMSHSIATEIELDYTALGVLKSQGFTKGRIRTVLMLQYLAAETAGVLAGCLLALPLEQLLGKAFQSVTGVLPDHGIILGKTMLFTAGMLLVSAGLVFLKTRKIAGISPVRAISGGREEIYFSSRLNLPISKRILNLSLAFRQFTSAKRRYLGVIFITAILTFCMITVNLVGVLFSSRTALGMMGFVIPDIRVTFLDQDKDADFSGVEEIIRAHTGITQKNSTLTQYSCLNGESLYCEMYEDPNGIPGILQGRAPIYDNEIVITEMVADALELKMGDTVTVTNADSEGQYLISGIYQAGNDAGMTFAMGLAAASKVGVDTNVYSRYYLLEDPAQADAIAQELSEKYTNRVNLWVYDEENNSDLALYTTIIRVLKIVIYAFALLFSFIVIRMVCAKAFLQERTDIGIYKAVGFTSQRLRMSFALRYLMVAAVGAGIGTACSFALSEHVLSGLFRVIGIVHVEMDFTVPTVVVPVAVISVSAFVFSYLVSRKIQRVAVRELITE